jgi:phosphonatase-like hydrolase
MIKMIVFDMAGTTVDEDNVVYKTLQNAINKAGFQVSLEQVLLSGAGKEKRNAIQDIIALSNLIVEDDLIDNIYNDFVTSLSFAYENLQLKPQPEALELFKALRERNIFITLNTGYNKRTALSILEKLDWQLGIQYDCLITATDVSKNRPSPDMILLAMKQMCISNAEEVIKVGDSTIDIEEGKNAGCSLTVGITTGAHTYEQLTTAKPNFIIHHLAELLAIIQN